MDVKSTPIKKGILFFQRHFIIGSLMVSAVLGLLAVLLFCTSISPLYESFSYDPVDVDSIFFYYWALFAHPFFVPAYLTRIIAKLSFPKARR
jgi:hypothetical protein